MGTARPTAYQRIRVRPLADALGAEVSSGVDLAAPLDSQTLEELSDADTGRKSLFISPGYVRGVDGMSDAAAQALIKELCEWAIQPEFVFTHCWRRHDVLMWDNRPTMHARTAFDFGRQRRIMHRTTLVGDAPVV